MKSSNIMIPALLSSIVLIGCSSEPDKYDVEDYDETTSPASLYCVQEGGTLEMVTENNVRMTYCVLSEDEKVEQWEFYNNNHDQETEKMGEAEEMDETKEMKEMEKNTM